MSEFSDDVSHRLARLPRTHRVDILYAQTILDFADMVALSELFQRWAFEELDLDPNYRTALIQWASDYEAVAAFSGPSWIASGDHAADDPMRIVARAGRAASWKAIKENASVPTADAADVSLEPREDATSEQDLAEAQCETRYINGQLREFARRMETIICNDDDPVELIELIIADAESATLHIEAWGSRTRDPLMFVVDLVTENPQAYGWVRDTIANHGVSALDVHDRQTLLEALTVPWRGSND